MTCKVFHTVTTKFRTKKMEQFGSLSCVVRGQNLYIVNVAVVTLPSYDLVTSYGLTRRVLPAALRPVTSWYITNTQSGWHNPRPFKTRRSEQNRRAALSSRYVMRYNETVNTSHRQPCYFCSTERFSNLNKTVRVLGFSRRYGRGYYGMWTRVDVCLDPCGYRKGSVLTIESW
jgi:hypothetical protein